VELQDLKLTVPADWKAMQPSSRLRLAEFSIPAAEGDTEASELVVFPPFGGSVEQNVSRWVTQFEGEGRQVRMRKGASTHGDYVLVDMQGTYKKPVGPPIQGRTAAVENYRMLAVILMVEGKGNYFLKVTGPQKTVAGVVDAFRTSFGADKEKEVDYELSN
jgi:gluconolactonase